MDLAARIKRIQSGAKTNRARHLRRANQISQAIKEQFGLKFDEQLRAKHLRWFLENGVPKYGQVYPYWLTVRRIVDAFDKSSDWLPHLVGPWCRTGTGGRPPILGNTRRNVG